MNKILSIVTLFVLMVPVVWGQDTVTDIDGKCIEKGDVADLFSSPKHDYTRELLNAT